MNDRRFRLGLVFNVVRTISGGLTNVLVPLFLATSLSVPAYSAWALLFAISAYFMYMDFGLIPTVQSKAARLVASGSLEDLESLATNFRQAIKLLVGTLCLLGVTVVVLVPLVYPQIRAFGSTDLYLTSAILVAGQIGSLTFAWKSAFLLGLQDMMRPATVAMASRLLALCLVVLVGSFTSSLPIIALAFSLPLLFSSAFVRVPVGNPHVIPFSRVFSLLADGAPVFVWGLCSLVTSGLGLVLIGRFDYASVPVASLAMVGATGVAQVASALTASLLSLVGGRAASASPGDLFALTLRILPLNACVLGVIGSGVTLILLYAGSKGLLPIEGGKHTFIVVFFVFAFIVRIACGPISVYFIALNLQTRLWAPPVVDAGLYAVLVLMATIHFGAPGAALASTGGAVLSTLLLGFWSLRIAKIRPWLATQALLRIYVPIVGALLFVGASLRFLGLPTVE